MTKQQKKKFKSKKNQDNFERWLRNHYANIIMAANLTHFKLRALCSGDLGSSAMTIVPRHDYLEVTLNYDVSWAVECWEQKDYKELIQILCHEVAHIPTTEAEDKLHYASNEKEVDYYFERITEITSRWLYNYYNSFYMPSIKVRIETGTQ